MALSQKHFDELAEIVEQHSKLHGECTHVVHLANSIADLCERDNPRFNRGYFMDACGPQLAGYGSKEEEVN